MSIISLWHQPIKRQYVEATHASVVAAGVLLAAAGWVALAWLITNELPDDLLSGSALQLLLPDPQEKATDAQKAIVLPLANATKSSARVKNRPKMLPELPI